MKILIINTVKTDKNGITMVIFNYLKAMNTNNITFDLVSPNMPDCLHVEDVEKKGGQVYVLPRTGRKIINYWIGLRTLIKSNRYDAIHIHGNSHTLVLELSAIWAAGCNTRIVHSHNTTCTYKGIHQLMTWPFNGLCTHRLACGVEAGKWMFGKKRFSVINNGIDTNKFQYNKNAGSDLKKVYCWSNCKVIGHIGTFNPVKNQSFLISVFDKLIKHDSTYRLLLIGEGKLYKQMQDKVVSLGLSDFIKFTGNVTNVFDYVNMMDLVVMPSLFEGLPLTLIEQQANGLQCIVSDTITKEADKTGNLKFVSLDAPILEWVNTILSLDLEGREARSLKAIEKIKECGYSIQEEAEKLKDYYKRAIYSK